MAVSGPKAVFLSFAGLFLLTFQLSAAHRIPDYAEEEEEKHCSRREHPVIYFEDLKPWVSNFTYSGVRDFSQLALDANRNQLIVGARNYLFRLSLHNVSLIQATEWGSDEDTRRSCQSKGKTEFAREHMTISERRKDPTETFLILMSYSTCSADGGELTQLQAYVLLFDMTSVAGSVYNKPQLIFF